MPACTPNKRLQPTPCRSLRRPKCATLRVRHCAAEALGRWALAMPIKVNAIGMYEATTQIVVDRYVSIYGEKSTGKSGGG